MATGFCRNETAYRENGVHRGEARHFCNNLGQVGKFPSIVPRLLRNTGGMNEHSQGFCAPPAEPCAAVERSIALRAEDVSAG